MARKYEQKLRAEKQDETRRRIVEAAVELHGTVGPGATSLSAVAERAGVQRNTLYRHFPDERTLLFACSGHYSSQHPVPSTEGWSDIADPVERARHGLRALYAYSPYHHVQDGTRYPATLFVTGANDPRVEPWHSRKMTARLQAAQAGDAPFLLRTSDTSGHGMGTALSEEIEEWTDVLAFLYAQLGVSAE